MKNSLLGAQKEIGKWFCHKKASWHHLLSSLLCAEKVYGLAKVLTNSLKGWMSELAVLKMSWKQVFRGNSFDAVEVGSGRELEQQVPASQHP